MKTNVDIGRRIKSERQKLGMTQEELGLRFGVDKSTIARYEKGTRRPPDTFKSDFSQFVGQSVESVFY